jgi:hypothetical protein
MSFFVDVLRPGYTWPPAAVLALDYVNYDCRTFKEQFEVQRKKKTSLSWNSG